MVYSAMVKKASKIAFEAHKNDLDKAGYPYVMHPFYLAFQMDDENAVCVALLHDVIEDHSDLYTMADLEREGFSPEVLTALRLLTHDPSVPYMDYVKIVGKNALARKVKMADLRHNSDVSRLDGKPPRKIELYKETLEYLTALDKADKE